MTILKNIITPYISKIDEKLIIKNAEIFFYWLFRFFQKKGTIGLIKTNAYLSVSIVLSA
ncbi:hypothetical protein B0I21_11716 [Sphingobacterium paludis]|uniref:Uncharacterized protein n=1 Tax=Sphingobacterium paludis TaxID=1476465 RepID=A0A4R7CU57_9SPHI|nr:hypothetical protein B0I21_11716 [Sphingobacterium paludis]